MPVVSLRWVLHSISRLPRLELRGAGLDADGLPIERQVGIIRDLVPVAHLFSRDTIGPDEGAQHRCQRTDEQWPPPATTRARDRAENTAGEETSQLTAPPFKRICITLLQSQPPFDQQTSTPSSTTPDKSHSTSTRFLFSTLDGRLSLVEDGANILRGLPLDTEEARCGVEMGGSDQRSGVDGRGRVRAGGD